VSSRLERFGRAYVASSALRSRKTARIRWNRTVRRGDGVYENTARLRLEHGNATAGIDQRAEQEGRTLLTIRRIPRLAVL
jgi:hypothetical protein